MEITCTVWADTLAIAKVLVERGLKIRPNCAGRTVIPDAQAICAILVPLG
ncbi:hypothetical protein HY626_01540 [Candidatus Uhrbacteria bacterium]|nr:hypothetical protein [Candidatus Uhrbacteria bacterium]